VCSHQLGVGGERADEGQDDQQQRGVRRLGEEEQLDQGAPGMTTIPAAISTTTPKER
jgi:hypothetical protein